MASSLREQRNDNRRPEEGVLCPVTTVPAYILLAWEGKGMDTH